MFYKLLVVDDNRGCAELYKTRFEHDEWEVMIAYSAEQAMEVLKDEDYLPDAILLDLMLPKMQGGEYLHVLRNDSKTKNIVIVVLTALNINSADQDEISSEADAYIMKIDIMPNELVKKVTELVEKKQIK